MHGFLWQVNSRHSLHVSVFVVVLDFSCILLIIIVITPVYCTREALDSVPESNYPGQSRAPHGTPVSQLGHPCPSFGVLTSMSDWPPECPNLSPRPFCGTARHLSRSYNRHNPYPCTRDMFSHIPNMTNLQPECPGVLAQNYKFRYSL